MTMPKKPNSPEYGNKYVLNIFSESAQFFCMSTSLSPFQYSE